MAAWPSPAGAAVAVRQTRSVKLAAVKGDGLEALRDRLAAACDEEELLPQLAANARELRMVLAAIAANPPAVRGDPVDELRRRREARRA